LFEWHAYIVTGHAWLSGNASWNDDDLGTFECLGETVILSTVSLDNSGCVDVREISGYTGGACIVGGSCKSAGKVRLAGLKPMTDLGYRSR
jgi:hypothetical protein